MFEPLPQDFSFPQAEERILAFWEQHQIFEKSLAQRQGAPRFVFYEGPPTANGLPHPGHCLTRAIKDLFPRYQTMCGRLVERKAGWDTHGLPVEVEVCKELGIHTKEEIEAYGVEKFNKKCIESVFRYTREWEYLTKRLGFWVNLEDAYVTFHQPYVESVWWSLKTLFERGLLYQGHKVVWWWAQGGTALSAGEVGEGYRTVQDPSVYVRFPLRGRGLRDSGIEGLSAASASQRASASEPGTQVTGGHNGKQARRHADIPGESLDLIEAVMRLEDDLDLSISDEDAQRINTIDDAIEYLRLRHPAAYEKAVAAGVAARTANVFAQVPDGKQVSLLVWTTTPWTLISNHFAAVAPEIDYAVVHDAAGDEYFVLAEALVASVAQKLKRELPVVARCKGAVLLGLRYAPPFDSYAKTLSDKTAPLAAGGTTPLAWRIVAADFVELGTGTGIVHIAPAYGEVDFNLLQDERRACAGYDAIPLLNAVAPNGTFNDDAPPAYRGRWVKDCDKDIIRELKERGILLHHETIEHEYPFCPRAENDALIQYARQSWFVRTSQFKDAFLANNAQIKWLPDHIQEGRFGDFLRNNVDWALSRERYWGTPLPIWVCEQTGKMEAIGSLAELMAKPGATDVTPECPRGMWATKKAEDPTLPDHLRVHKPYIDAWVYDSPFARGAKMRRVPEVIDCWWDAGSMPFAQWGYPHAPASIATFAQRFPADFISEAIDQTRGWFYGLLSISTLLFAGEAGILPAGGPAACPSRPFPHPYRTCIVLGHMMGEDGNKMSKRLRNYREPRFVFDHYGADAMRWYFFSAQVPWTSTRFVEASIRDAHREFLVKLYHVLSFFNIYANIDGFVAHPQYGSPWRPTRQRGELDRWIISELHRTIRFVREKLDAFENYPAAGRLNDFVDALSNWYVRRSRDRFWRPAQRQGAGNAPPGAGSGEPGTGSTAPGPRNDACARAPFPDARALSVDHDKWDAYHTLFGVLLELSKLIAPFTPFFAEVMYQNLVGGIPGAAAQGAGQGVATPDSSPPSLKRSSPLPPDRSIPLSVHLCDYPQADAALIDENLAQEMDLVRDIVSLGRAARTAAKLKVRQPLALAEIILARPEHAGWLHAHAELIAEELNIKAVEFSTAADHYVSYQIKPNFKSLGPKFGKLGKDVAAALQQLDPAHARASLASSGTVSVTAGGQTHQLTGDDVEIRLEAKPGWSAAQGRAGVVVVKTDLSPELLDEGKIRELIHHVQGMRKDLNLAYQARIALTVETDAELAALVQRYAGFIQQECLAQTVTCGPIVGGEVREVRVEGHATKLSVT